MTKRASVFDASDPDISDLITKKPLPPIDAAELKAAAEEKGFRSLAADAEPKSSASSTVVSAGEAPEDTVRRRQVQRETRSKPISIRATPTYFNRFIACLDALGPEYSQADGFEKAVEALEEQLGLKDEK